MPTLERETQGAPVPPSPPPSADASSAEAASEPRPEPAAPRRAFRVPLGAVVGLIAAVLLLLVARCSAGAGP